MTTLAQSILAGESLPSAAMGKADAYDALKAGKHGPKPLLGSSQKIETGESLDVLSRILYMMPAKSSGREACGGRSAGCTASCLAEETGHMSYPNAQLSRRWKHAAFYANRAKFMADLADEVAAAEKKANKRRMICAIRLNGTTDIPWERIELSINGMSYPNIMAAFPNVQFYDYTKLSIRHRTARRALPPNYHLTFSLSEREDAETKASDYIAAGYSVAVVFDVKKGNLPNAWALDGCGIIPVVDGDKHDARFLDPPGSIVGLSAKGRAKRDTTGFVRKVV